MKSPPVYLLLTATLIALSAVLRVVDPEPVARFRLEVFDVYQRLSPRTYDPANPVRILDIDSESLARFGQWPWPRTRLAEIVERLNAGGARAIALDIILPEPDRLSPTELARLVAGEPGAADLVARIARLPSNDARLAGELSKAPAILGFIAAAGTTASPGAARGSLAFAGDDPKLFLPSFPGSFTSLPMLAASAPGAGAMNWLPDPDQVVRRLPLLLTVAGTIQPSLALETLRIAQGQSTYVVKASGASGTLAFGEKTGIESVRVGSVILPTDASGQMWLNPTRADRRRYVPAHRLLDGAIPAADIKDRIFVIGSSAPGLLDLRATALDPVVPGVEIHAQALEQMLGGAMLTRPDYATGAELVFLVGIGALVAWASRRSGPLAGALIGLGSILAVTWASWLAFTRGGILLDPVYPSLALLVLYSAGTLYRYSRAELDRGRVRSAFQHYMAPALVEELAGNPDKLQLGGEIREVSLLFADVRGFTTVSEGMDAAALIRFVNRLFTPLSEIILAERGTIDKFMGDAVMAFWNAPLADPDHARNACHAALGMMRALTVLNDAWAIEQAARGETVRPVRIGIGLNTGACCVGNLGSTQRFDYSVIGDPVNVASRLEGETKAHGVPIICGQATAEAAGPLAFLEIGAVTVRGKARPERIFALLGDEQVATSQRFVRLKAAYGALVAAAAEADTAAMRTHIETCRSGWPELAPLFDIHARRLEKLAGA